MAKQDFTAEIKEYIAVIKESNSGWTKSVVRAKFGDNPITLDIRNINKDLIESGGKGFGKGISLSDEEADNLCNILLECDYGSMEVIEKVLTKRKKRFTLSIDEDRVFDESV